MEDMDLDEALSQLLKLKRNMLCAEECDDLDTSAVAKYHFFNSLASLDQSINHLRLAQFTLARELAGNL